MQFIIGKPPGYILKNMISVYLQGGIGNAMFQIAAIESLGKIFNQEVYYSNVNEWINYNIGEYAHGRQAIEYQTLFPKINLYKNHDYNLAIRQKINVPFRYSHLRIKSGDLLQGYFQSEQFFCDNIFVKELFIPRDDINNKLLKYSNLLENITCSINVRRGNYMKQQTYHPVLTMDYYNMAIKIIKSMKVSRFLVFSDDYNWCKNNFIGDEFIFIDDMDFVELFLMTKCTHHVIANSSYGWWGAWLGETSDTVTIAPKLWFGHSYPADYAEDIIPQRWIKI